MIYILELFATVTAARKPRECSVNRKVALFLGNDAACIPSAATAANRKSTQFIRCSLWADAARSGVTSRAERVPTDLDIADAPVLRIARSA